MIRFSDGTTFCLVVLFISLIKCSNLVASCCGRYPAKKRKNTGKYWEIDYKDLSSDEQSQNLEMEELP